MSNTLRLSLSADPSYLNPVLMTDHDSYMIVKRVFSGLFRETASLTLIPDLCERYDISSDGTIYTFYLRQNVTWHDGQPFTAEDVKFTYEKFIDPSTNTVRRGHFVIKGKPIRFNIMDSHTIQAILPRRYAPFLSVLTIGILPKHLLENTDINTAEFNRQPIGTGPFMFKDWKPNQFVYLMSNPNYYGVQPKIKGLLYKIIPDGNTALIALRNNEIDASGIPRKEVKRLSEDPNLTIYTYQRPTFSHLSLNTKDPIFKDKRIRQALDFAINKEAIIRSVLYGYGTVASIPSHPLLWAYPDAPLVRPYDPEKAKQLLASAGITAESPLSFTLIVPQGSKDGEKIAQLIQQYFSHVSITMDIQLMEWSSLLNLIHSSKTPKPFQAVLLSWIFDIQDPDDSYTSFHGSQYPAGGNFVGYQNRQVDVLLDRGRRLLDKKQRRKVYRQFYQHVAEDVPYIFLFHSDSIAGVRKRVKGLSDTPSALGLFHDLDDIYLEK